MHVIEKGCYLEIVSDCPGSLVLLLSLPETGNGLLGPELEVGQLGPRVGGQGLPEVPHLPPRRHVKFPSVRCCCLYVASKLLSNHTLVQVFEFNHIVIKLDILCISFTHRASLTSR